MAITWDTQETQNKDASSPMMVASATPLKSSGKITWDTPTYEEPSFSEPTFSEIITSPNLYPEYVGKIASAAIQPAKEQLSGLATLYGGSEQGIASKLASDIQSGAEDYSKGNYVKGTLKAGGRTAADVLGTVWAPVGAAIGSIPGVAKGTDAFANWYVDKFGKDFTEDPAVWSYLDAHPNTEEDVSRAINLVLTAQGGKKSAYMEPIEPKTMIPRTVDQAKRVMKRVIGTTGTPATETTPAVPPSGLLGIAPKIKEAHANAAAEEVARNIALTEQVGKKGTSIASPEDNASRLRIAKSNVLADVKPENGYVPVDSVKQAAKDYLRQTTAGAEGVVYDALVKSGDTVNYNDLISYLEKSINESRLDAAVKGRALDTGVRLIITGLMRTGKIDGLGDVKLADLHMEKIHTTNNIDYSKPASMLYKKAVASALRQIVEDKSTVKVPYGDKVYGVKQINEALAPYLKDADRIRELGGRRVAGGKLGKYVAQGVGTGVGMALGQAMGAVGAGVGGAIGGEVGRVMQERKMAGTFGKDTGTRMEQPGVLRAAQEVAKEHPLSRDLTIPDRVLGAPKSIPKSHPEYAKIYKIQKDIRDNVAQQKAFIKAGDFEVVARLKEIYDILVARLREIAKKIQETPNKQGGFISGSDRKPVPPRQTQSVQKGLSSADDTTHLAKTQAVGETALVQEAKKYATPEEFVKAQGTPMYHGTNSKFDTFDSNKINTVETRGDYAGSGFYFTDSQTKASRYANQAVKKNGGNSNIIEAYLDIKNPLTINSEKDAQALRDSFGGDEAYFTIKPLEIKNELQKRGYDGVVDNLYGQKIVFSPNQIKTSSQLTSIWNQSHQTSDLSSSIAKAKASGMSFDEWVKGQGEPIYRGSGANKGNNTDLFGKGTYYTNDINEAKYYGENISDAVIKPTDIFDGTKPFDQKTFRKISSSIDQITNSKIGSQFYDDVANWYEGDIPKEIITYKQLFRDMATDKKFFDAAKKLNLPTNDFNTESNIANLVNKAIENLGYKGAKFNSSEIDALVDSNLGKGTSYVMWDKNAFKTRIQLRAEWDKVK